MASQNLKQALRTAGMTPEEFADIIKVDPKTVQRWVAGTTTPYPRHRAAISRALHLTERELWPDQDPTPPDPHAHDAGVATSPAGCDVTSTWASASDDNAPGLVAFINDTTGPIDVLDSCCGLEITYEVTDALLTAADDGRRVRILTDGQAPRWERLLGHDSIKTYLFEIPGEYWLIRTADQMLLTINLDHDPGSSPPPILQLSPAAEGGLFHKLTTRFEELWALTGADEPKQPESDPRPIRGGDRGGDSLGGSAARTAFERSQSGEPSGRRWPRQPA